MEFLRAYWLASFIHVLALVKSPLKMAKLIRFTSNHARLSRLIGLACDNLAICVVKFPINEEYPLANKSGEPKKQNKQVGIINRVLKRIILQIKVGT